MRRRAHGSVHVALIRRGVPGAGAGRIGVMNLARCIVGSRVIALACSPGRAWRFEACAVGVRRKLPTAATQSKMTQAPIISSLPARRTRESRRRCFAVSAHRQRNAGSGPQSSLRGRRVRAMHFLSVPAPPSRSAPLRADGHTPPFGGGQVR